jgi:hypothetical protein
MAAAYLNRMLRRPGTEEALPITVVESEEIGTVGVGEATIPTLRNFLRLLEVPEWQFLLEAEASLKHGIRFRDWMRPAAGSTTHEYFHPFEVPPVIEGRGAEVHWVALRDRGLQQPALCEAVGSQSELSRQGKSPRLFLSLPYESPIPYAYHLDAIKFGGWLRSVALSRGVKHIRDTVLAVHRSQEQGISHLTTAAHGDLKADFYIDASGFTSLLLGQSLGEPFVDWSDHLLCDRAVAMQLPYERDASEIRPYTTATAKPSGWIWEIDLFSRRGNGYVYSSRHCSADAAERTLREHLGPAARDVPARHLRMQIGHRRQMWIGNCLAIGLAAGFVEPLESTGIHLVELALGLFADFCGGGAASPYLAARFNQQMQQTYEEIRDFLQIHYVLSNREDSAFWRDYRFGVAIPDSLRSKLDYWTFKLPVQADLDRARVFGPHNYTYILAGLDALPAAVSNLSPYIARTASVKALQFIEEGRRRVVAAHPSHRDFLQKQRAIARPADAA